MIPDRKNPKPSPASIVLDILSTKPALTIKQVHRYYIRKQNISLQGLYHVVKQLIVQRILVKQDGRLFIDLGWIKNLQAFMSQLEETYLEQQVTHSTILVKAGESSTFSFASAIEMDNFYNHVLLVLVEHHKNEPNSDKDVYAYNPHNWFQLIRTHQEEELLQAYRIANMNVYQLVGSESFLDKLTLQMFDKDDHFFVKQIKSDEKIYSMSIGDFCIEVSLASYLNNIIDDYFQSIKSLAEYNANTLMRLVSQPSKTQMKISRDKKKAKLFREMIQSKL